MHQLRFFVPRRWALWAWVTACLLLSACERPEPLVEAAAAPGPLPVQTVTLEPRSWQLSFASYGHFEATESITISVDFSGTVDTVHFRDGQRISAGQLLIELDDRKQQLRLKRANANLESAGAELEKVRATYYRYRNLMASGALSREQLKQSEAAFERARAAVEEAEAALALARQDLRETRIISPVDGVVASRSVDPGQTVLPGNPLAVVQVADTLRLVTFVSEKEVNQLRLGDIAEVSSPAVPGSRYQARIELLGSAADPQTGNFTVKLTVNNSERLLRPGMSASVRMSGVQRDNTLVLPKALMVDRNRRRVVYRYEDGIAREVEPVLGASAGDELPVLTGLAAGDRIITSYLDVLADGQRVSLAPRAEESAERAE